jgi:hypothetical protein
MKLTDALTYRAEQAHSYADPDAAVRAARRRRRRRGALAVAAVGLAVVATLTLPQLWPSPRLTSPASPTPAVAYPANVAVPTNAPPLPSDRPVGVAAFIYTKAQDTFLVASDGSQYNLGDEHALPGGLTSLSPDGRWLLRRNTLRDLTATTTHQVAPVGIARWSPQARWIHVEVANDTYRRIEVATGRVTQAPPAEAILDDGQLVIARTAEHKRATLAVVDPRTGGETRRFTVDAANALPGEYGIAWRAGDNPYRLGRLWPVTNDRAVLPIAGYDTLVLLDVSLIDGAIVGKRTVTKADGRWAVAGIDSDTIVLARTGSDDDNALALATPAGPPRVVSRFPTNTSVLVRGAMFSL